MYLIKQVSELSGVSVRTLHHYDQMGLLVPNKADNGYRFYTENELNRLQAILFYKYLGFSLKEIQTLLLESEEKIIDHLKRQLTYMEKEKSRLLTLIGTLEKTIDSYERNEKLTMTEKFAGFTYQQDPKYTQMAIEKYGKDVVEKTIEKQRGKEEELTAGFNRIFFAFAENLENHIEASETVNVELAKELHKHLCQYSFDCSTEIFSYIGYGYVQNEEFKKNIDQFGVGTAQYVCDAIQAYVNSR